MKRVIRSTNSDAGAAAYARALLASLGAAPAFLLDVVEQHPALGWARSGLMTLTGAAEPRMCPAAITVCADGALVALASLAPPGAFAGMRGSDLLAERAAIAGQVRAGAVSPGGSCRLLEAADGWFALNLARAEDWGLLAAWLEMEVAADWDFVGRAVRSKAVEVLISRGRDLGLALAAASIPPSRVGRGEGKGDASEAHLATQSDVTPVPGGHASLPFTQGQGENEKRAPLVIDLSALWAGPLCGHLLLRAGARVIKLESTQRPDGARRGPAAFFDLMHAGKQSVALDFSSASGRAQLRALLLRANIVIESSRPRALRQFGIHAEQLLQENPRLTWLSITGYGRGAPQENWIAFGDDAGVAAGLSQLMFAACGERLIVGDAMADPLTGLHAALVAWASYRAGGGQLLSISLREVVEQCMHWDLPPAPAALRTRMRAWTDRAQIAGGAQPPRARRCISRARELGADTAAVLAEFGIAC